MADKDATVEQWSYAAQKVLILGADGATRASESNLFPIDPDSTLTKAIAYNGTGSPEYIGWAEPGTNKGSAFWRIQKLTYNSTSAVTDIQWAGSTAEFTKEWDERASYNYG